MSSYITHPGGTLTPTAIAEYDAQQDTGNQVHPILGSASADITLAPMGLRYGQMNLVFTTESDADAARIAHTAPATFTLVSADRPALNMTYIIVDSIGGVSRGDGGEWVVTVGFQEVG